jgi:hypothetical protein
MSLFPRTAVVDGGRVKHEPVSCGYYTSRVFLVNAFFLEYFNKIN